MKIGKILRDESSVISDDHKNLVKPKAFFIKPRDQVAGPRFSHPIGRPQVGVASLDSMHWSTPDGMGHVDRRAFALDSARPGSDVTGEMAAALAASSLVFRRHGDNMTSYADSLVAHAERLFRFAVQYRECYHR